MIKVDSEVKSKMLGAKIDLFRRLIAELARPQYGYDSNKIEVYRSLLEPLREIARIRNRIAHELRFSGFELTDIPSLLKVVQDLKPSLAYSIEDPADEFKPLVAVAVFGFLVSEKLAFLQQTLV